VMKVGLVLGAGGVLGGAWLTGGLEALASETGWDPGSADRIVGTSAGSVIGAFVAAGIPPWFMVAHSRGESFEGLNGPDGRPAAEADRAGGGVFKLHRGLPSLGPGSWRLALSTVTRPTQHTPMARTVGWLPRGVISTDSIRQTVARAVPEGWVDHPSFWAVACDYDTGQRVPFGREDAPPAELPDAVAASCAIPGFYRPVEIGGRSYVDGGVCSASNLDLVKDCELDLVVCLNPTSTLEPSTRTGVLDRMAQAARSGSGRRLGYEAKKLRAAGTELVLVQPVADDLEVMGANLMSGKRRNEVIETARETVAQQLRVPEVRDALAGLPAGEPHRIRMPDGPASEWPELVPSPSRRAA
jgi:NTE family protein